mmetsp:Transcript_19602/g.66405  ORF Transcript_19602/g.66405 Transcript_19602/m.66405 type:complete len:238 (+) Transcript_19602:71-784(+)
MWILLSEPPTATSSAPHTATDVGVYASPDSSPTMAPPLMSCTPLLVATAASAPAGAHATPTGWPPRGSEADMADSPTRARRAASSQPTVMSWPPTVVTPATLPPWAALATWRLSVPAMRTASPGPRHWITVPSLEPVNVHPDTASWWSATMAAWWPTSWFTGAPGLPRSRKLMEPSSDTEIMCGPAQATATWKSLTCGSGERAKVTSTSPEVASVTRHVLSEEHVRMCVPSGLQATS